MQNTYLNIKRERKRKEKKKDKKKKKKEKKRKQIKSKEKQTNIFSQSFKLKLPDSNYKQRKCFFLTHKNSNKMTGYTS